MNKEQLKKAIEEKKKEIDCWEADPYDYEEQYCNMIDEQGDIKIGGLTFQPSNILKMKDPTAYRCGLLDYVDSLDLTAPDELFEELEMLKEKLEEETI